MADRQVSAQSRRALQMPVVPVAVLLLLALYAVGVTWGSGYATPFYREALAYGQGNRDTLFHAAYAGMFQTYGVFSTGLDGLPAFNYHFGSHALAAGIAQFTGFSTLEVYHYLYPLLLPALFLIAFGWFVVGLRPRNYTWIFWFLLLAGIARVIPQPLARPMGLNSSSLLSESNALAFALVFLLVGMLVRGFHRRTTFVLIALPILCFLIGITKQSALYLTAAGLGYLWLHCHLYRRPMYLASAALVALACLAAYRITSGTYASTPLMPLDLTNYLGTPLALWFVTNFGWAWLYIALRLREQRPPYTDVWLLLALIVAGLLPALLLAIPGGSAFYFVDLQRFVAVALLLAWLPRHLTYRTKIVVAFVGVLAIINVAFTLLGIVRSLPPTASYSPVLAQLESFDAQPDTALYIPRNHLYWRIMDDERACGTIPFLAPAVTGLAMIHGLPDTDCASAIHYGYHSYSRNDESVCETARRYGIRRVIVLATVQRAKVVNC